MNKNHELIHKLLDDEVSAEERTEILNIINADPALKQEFDDLSGIVMMAEEIGRMPVPSFFTAEVMKRLPPGKATFRQRVRDFLFKGRVLRWNMAAALAAAGLVVLVLVQLVRVQNRPVETAAVPQPEQAVTVTMNFYAPQARHVAVAGTFNKWKADANVLKKQENGLWTITIPLKPGVYTYMFVVDGKAWVTDPNADSYRDDGFGYKNSVLRVKI